MDLIAQNALGQLVDSSRYTELSSVSDIVERALLVERRGLYGHEQRETDRYPYSRLVQITPYDTSNECVLGDPISVPCRNLSLHGLGFYHTKALASRYASVQLMPGSDEPEMVIKLIWCRFLKPGWYDNGGRFVRVATNKPKLTA